MFRKQGISSTPPLQISSGPVPDLSDCALAPAPILSAHLPALVTLVSQPDLDLSPILVPSEHTKLEEGVHTIDLFYSNMNLPRDRTIFQHTWMSYGYSGPVNTTVLLARITLGPDYKTPD